MKPKRPYCLDFTQASIADLIFTTEYKNTVNISFIKRPYETEYNKEASNKKLDKLTELQMCINKIFKA